MQIEIIEYYPDQKPLPKHEISGSLHIYLIDFDADLKGVEVKKKKSDKFIYFGMPSKRGYDPETGEPVRFPTFSLLNREKHQELIKEIRRLGEPFVKQWHIERKLGETILDAVKSNYGNEKKRI